MSNRKSSAFGIALATILTLSLQSNALAAQAPPPLSVRMAITQLFLAYEGAWDRSDGKALAATYVPTGDLMIPTGQLFSGQSSIATFYDTVFTRGYGRTRGTGLAQHVRMLSLNTAIVDGIWSIRGVRDASAKTHDESGVFTAVIVRANSVWKLAALREQTSGKSVSLQ